MSSFISPARSQLYTNRGLGYLFGIAAGVAGGFSFHLRRRALEEERRQAEAVELANSQPPYELTGLETKNYPWIGKLNDWEYRQIKARGYFSPDRLLVRKVKDGKVGYSVFAEFFTHMADGDPHAKYRQSLGQPVSHGVLVNLGWIPDEAREDIYQSVQPIGSFFKNEISSGAVYKDPDTGFEYFVQRNEDNRQPRPIGELVAVVRRGERPNLLAGNTIFEEFSNVNYVDLDYLSKYFNMPFTDMARAAYLERVVPDITPFKNEGKSNFLFRKCFLSFACYSRQSN